MTGLLEDVMKDRADRLGPLPLDLDAIVADGDRRVRHRRAFTGIGAVAAVATAVVAIGVALPDGHLGSRQVAPADGTDAAPLALTWAQGSRILDTDGVVADVGHPIRAFVATGTGFAFTTGDRAVWTWRDGAVHQVGSLARTRPDEAELLADAGRVAWVDAARGFTVLDPATGVARHLEVTATAAGGPPPRVTALDGNVAYVVDGRGVSRWDVAVDEVTTRGPLSDPPVLDAAGGAVLLGGSGPGRGAVEWPDGAIVPVDITDFANLSPEADWVTTSFHDTGYLRDARTGAGLPFVHGHDWAVGYQWLDDDTFAALVFDAAGGGYGAPGLVTCEAPSGTCTDAVVTLPADLQLPIGVHFAP